MSANEKKNPTELCAGEPETDIGNGRRLTHRHGERILHVAHIGWHGYDGKRWREDADGSVVRPLVHETAEAIIFETEYIVLTEAEEEIAAAGDDAEAEMTRRGVPDAKASREDRAAYGRLGAAVASRDLILKKLDDRRASRARHAKSSAGSAKLDNMLREALPYRAVTIDDLNPDRLALNCGNGTLRFIREDVVAPEEGEPRQRTVARLDPPRREDMISKLVGTDIPGAPIGEVFGAAHFEAIARARAPLFFAFMKKIQPNPDMRRYLQRLAGYMLTGLTNEQMVAFFHGIGANGKSTLTELWGRILADYAVTLSIDSFAGDSNKDGGSATPDLVRLIGARACFASEGDEGVKIREGLIKLLTGGDKFPVRRMRQEFVEIEMQATVVITGNHKPQIRGDDDGIWRRVHLVDFPVQIPKAERDRDLPAKLWAERDGVLAWMISGALEFLSLGGLLPPKAVVDMTQEHREESDPIGAFIRGGCDVTGAQSDTCTPGELYLAYCAYCRAEGLFAFNQTTLTRRLPEQAKKAWTGPDGTQQMFAKVKANITQYRGIRIRELYRDSAIGIPSARDYPPGYGG